MAQERGFGAGTAWGHHHGDKTPGLAVPVSPKLLAATGAIPPPASPGLWGAKTPCSSCLIPRGPGRGAAFPPCTHPHHPPLASPSPWGLSPLQVPVWGWQGGAAWWPPRRRGHGWHCSVTPYLPGPGQQRAQNSSAALQSAWSSSPAPLLRRYPRDGRGARPPRHRLGTGHSGWGARGGCWHLPTAWGKRARSRARAPCLPWCHQLWGRVGVGGICMGSSPHRG